MRDQERRTARDRLAVPVAAAVVAGAAFVLLLVQVLTAGPLLEADPAVRTVVIAHRVAAGVGAAVVVSRVAAFPGEVVAGLLLAAALAVRARSPNPLVMGVVGMLALLAVPVTKELVGRVRPPASLPAALLADDLGRTTSFPSGHAATAAVFAGLIYIFAAPHLARLGRRLVGVAAAGYATVVGAARLYLGVHWLTDVLAGWALGIVVVAGLAILAHLRPILPRTEDDPAR